MKKFVKSRNQMNEKVGGMKDKSMRRELRKIESEEK